MVMIGNRKVLSDSFYLTALLLLFERQASVLLYICFFLFFSFLSFFLSFFLFFSFFFLFFQSFGVWRML